MPGLLPSMSGPTRVVLAHEGRLALRGLMDMAGPASPSRPWRIGGVIAVILLIITGVAQMLLLDAGALDPADPGVRIMLTINLAFIFVLMVSAALDSAAHALYARGDYDLLFSAPLSPRTVLLVRALNVLGFTVAKAGLYGAPLILLLAWERGAHWLAGLPLMLALALMATALAIGLAMGLVRLIGVRSMRVVAQVVAALAGLLVLVMVKWDAIFGPGPRDALIKAYAADQAAPLWRLVTLPARAMTTDPAALAAMLALAGLFAALMFIALAESFVRNAVLAAGSATSGPMKSHRSKASFGRSPFAVLMLKERRIILRDPWLMSQILMQCIFLLPIVIVTVFRVVTGANDTSALAPILIVLTGQIAGGLTWIAVSGDDASELSLTAPLNGRLRQRARLAAVAWLAAALAAPPLMLVMLFDAWTGLVSFAGAGLAILCAMFVNLWHQPRLARTGMIRRRMKSPVTVTLMELATLTLVAVACWPLLMGEYLAGGVGLVLVAITMGALFAARRRELA
jgi:ABC-2 type transport system permease protein